MEASVRGDGHSSPARPSPDLEGRSDVDVLIWLLPPRINYERENGLSIYAGLGAAWRMTPHWTVQAELVSYDQDARVLSLGVRWRM